MNTQAESEDGQISEKRLIELAAKDDQNALELLFSRYLKRVYNVALGVVLDSEEAEDIVQETFIKIWKNLGKFEIGRNFSAWVYEISKNTALTYLRKKRAMPFSAFDSDGRNVLEETYPSSAPLPWELAQSNMAVQAVQRDVRKLTPDQQLVFFRKNDGMTFREIAEELGQSLNTIKSRYWRSLRKLKEFLSE